MKNIIVDHKDLENFTKNILRASGLDPYSLDAVTMGLVESSLRSVDSHGVRLLPHYSKSALTGRKNPKPKFKIMRKFPTIAHLDADNAFGHASGMKAIELGMEMAKEFGMGAVGVANSSHPGAMGSFALRAARQGFICFAFTHADALTKTFGGTKAFFGTNPICFAAPRNDGEPFCLDMATSCAPWNKVIISRAQNKNLEEGIAADQNGNPTTDPHLAASVMPLGGDLAGYKGVGLAAMVEVLCALFTGMNFGPHLGPMFKPPMTPRHLGQFYLLIRSDGCVDQNYFLNEMHRMYSEFHQSPVKTGEEIFLPGEKEENAAKRRSLEGVPLMELVFNELNDLAQTLEVSPLMTKRV